MLKPSCSNFRIITAIIPGVPMFTMFTVHCFQLPKFYYLCEDGVWGVRKACAECFMTVSSSCSPVVRKSELSGLFVNLLCDQSRWVSHEN